MRIYVLHRGRNERTFPQIKPNLHKIRFCLSPKDPDLLLNSEVKWEKKKNTVKFPFNKQTFPLSSQQIETLFVDFKYKTKTAQGLTSLEEIVF